MKHHRKGSNALLKAQLRYLMKIVNELQNED